MGREARTFSELLPGDTRVTSFNRVRDILRRQEGFGWALGYGGPNRGHTARGSYFEQLFHCDSCRYTVESSLSLSFKGWQQWDTDQDAWYYGVWVNFARRMIVSYAEGDLYIQISLDDGSYRAELASLREFHGEAPVTAWAIDEDGAKTEYRAQWPDFDAWEDAERVKRLEEYPGGCGSELSKTVASLQSKGSDK